MCRFIRNTEGNAAIAFALVLVPMAGLTGVAVDYVRAAGIKETLQNVADSAALAAASNTTLTNDEKKQVAEAFFAENWNSNNNSSAPVPTVSIAGNEISVRAELSMQTTIAGVMGISQLDIGVVAVAAGKTIPLSPCVLALDPTERRTLNLTGGSSIDARDCAVIVNSSDEEAVNLTGGAWIEAQTTCVKGGIKALAENINPRAILDCGPIADPLANFVPPPFGTCDYFDFEESGGVTITLDPGVYCGGIKLTGGPDITFNPGVYVIKDGWLETTGGGNIYGEGVTFHIVGDDAGVEMSGGAVVRLTAPTTDDFAGIIFYQEPTASPGETSKLSGGGELYYEGVIYFPTQELEVSGGGLTATPSPFTWYIVNNFEYSGGSELYIKSDMTAAGVPLPHGVSAVGVSDARLVR